MRARWLQVPNPYPSNPAPPGGSSTQWVVVDEDDEILASVAGGGQWWHANILTHAGLGVARSGAFISEHAAKNKVEKWLSPGCTFVPVNTWVYKTNP